MVTETKITIGNEHKLTNYKQLTRKVQKMTKPK